MKSPLRISGDSLRLNSMEKFKEICDALKEAVPGEYPWEWDGRFDMPLVCIKEEAAVTIAKKLEALFEATYDQRLKDGPKEIKKLAKALMGIKKGQLLFSTPIEDEYLFGAWWPWGDNSQVSFRVGLYSLNKGISEEAEDLETFRRWFGFAE